MGITAQRKIPGLGDQAGFTLIEILSVLVILSVLAAVTIYRFDFLSQTASRTALAAGVKELNVRETLVWTQAKLSQQGWTSDENIFAAMDTNLGPDYFWSPAASKTGGTLHFRSYSTSIVLTRIPSTSIKPAVWQ
jgi:prepilin-type N-terminal cleavage/methylation domain-containing protein